MICWTPWMRDFEGQETLRQRLVHRMPKYGNDDEYADELMVRVFNTIFEEVDGRPNSKGGRYQIEMLPTTCHVYFGSVTGATPDGRRPGLRLSEGISPVQGADRHGPTAVVKSASKMDHIKTGGTLLNMKFTPSLLADEEGSIAWPIWSAATSPWKGTTCSSMWFVPRCLKKPKRIPMPTAT